MSSLVIKHCTVRNYKLLFSLLLCLSLRAKWTALASLAGQRHKLGRWEGLRLPHSPAVACFPSNKAVVMLHIHFMQPLLWSCKQACERLWAPQPKGWNGERRPSHMRACAAHEIHAPVDAAVRAHLWCAERGILLAKARWNTSAGLITSGPMSNRTPSVTLKESQLKTPR